MAEFVTTRELDLVNCSEITDKEPTTAEREEYIWARLNWAFSEPITPTESTADYAPTQVLAEVFKHAGYDGIMYGSSVGPGTNVALFDLWAASVTHRTLFETTKLRYEFDSAFSRRRRRRRQSKRETKA